VNQGTARVVIIVVLVALGAVVLANGFDGDGAAAGPTPSGSPSATTTPPTPTESGGEPTPTETPSPQTTGVLFSALNGTSVTGLAAEVQEALVAEGYVAPEEPGNAPQAGVQVTTVYFRDGDNAAQNRSDATYVAETFFPDIEPEVKKLTDAFLDIVPNSATLVIVVGQDYADAVAV
jgi:hypothetical protein